MHSISYQFIFSRSIASCPVQTRETQDCEFMAHTIIYTHMCFMFYIENYIVKSFGMKLKALKGNMILKYFYLFLFKMLTITRASIAR